MSDQRIVLFTSNCYGEDIVAALIARELNALFEKHGLSEKFVSMGAPLISEGRNYTSRGIELLTSSYVPPSGGFPTLSLKGFFSDLFSGSFGILGKFKRALKAAEDRIELCFVVGDVSLLLATRMGIKKPPMLFISMPKSDYIEPHYQIEINYIRKHIEHFLVRDQFTATNLQKQGVNAIFLGNPMMDELSPKMENLDVGPYELTLGFLPGSREEAGANFIESLKAAEIVFSEMPVNLIAALPGTLPDEKIAEMAKEIGFTFEEKKPFPVLKKGKMEVLLSRGIFTDVILKSDVILGLAGTADEQAAGMGTPIIHFIGQGPLTTKARVKKQGSLLGDALYQVHSQNSREIADAVLMLLKDPEERKRRGEVGREHMGKSGGAKRIAEFVFEQYFSSISE